MQTLREGIDADVFSQGVDQLFPTIDRGAIPRNKGRAVNDPVVLDGRLLDVVFRP